MERMGNTTADNWNHIDYAQMLRDGLAHGFSSMPRSLKVKLLQAGLFDASGKYPSGLLQGTRVDMGAFDECLETVLHDQYGSVTMRGQYCNLLIYVKDSDAMKEKFDAFSDVIHPRLVYFKDYATFKDVPLGRLGICFTDECNQADMQAIVDSVKPPVVRLEVSNCVTAEPEPWTKTQIGIGGFFLCLTVSRRRGTGPIQYILLSVIKRLIRMCVPLFFVIMCLCLLQPFVTGPDAKTFFQRLHDDILNHWWQLLLQIRNFYEIVPWDLLVHMWYLSADFQLYVVALVTLVILRGHRVALVATFVTLSLLGCALGTWAVMHHRLFPFEVYPAPDLRFCNLTGWCVSVSCGLTSVFAKLAWYRNPSLISEAITLFAAFFDRILWSVLLIWVALACSSGRAGFVGRFLSWNAFVPLSKLSFGVYLIHMPFIQLMLHASRERVLWSMFNVSATNASREDAVTTATPSSATTAIDEDYIDYVQLLRGALAQGFASIPNSMKTKLLGADVSAECLAGLLRTLRGFLNLELWAVRLFDASGKYPTGVLQGARADIGAFDECLDTSVRDAYGRLLSRGQYCNLVFYVENSTAMESNIDALSDVLHPKFLYFRNYLTLEDVPLGRIGICFIDDCGQDDLQALVDTLIIISATTIDHVVNCRTKDSKRRGALLEFAAAFSATANTSDLLKVADKAKTDQYAMQFLHGMRFLCTIHIVIGHFYTTLSDSWSKICFPLFFVIMGLYLLPRFVTGPDAKAGFQKLFDEVDYHWWHMLLQVRNFYENTIWDVLIHTWYLSADFQLYLVALLTLLILKGRKMVLLAAFATYSLVGCAFGTWVVARQHLLPFMIFPGPVVPLLTRTLNEFYIRPYYHAVCYFSGCMTFLLMVDFRKANVTKGVQLVGWCVSVSCGLISVFAKLAWYRSPDPVSESVTLLVAFFDRILWSIFIVWITLSCASGRGGFVSTFLSWNAFVPLSKLSFGVYLIHLPFIQFMLHASKERVTLWFGVLSLELHAILSSLPCL
ncbi:hypothetical protein MTO96_019764 [Rhipicephalus appendiculatus]